MSEDKRTIQQNKAVRKFGRLLAAELNAKGYDMEFVFKQMAMVRKIPWTGDAVIEHLWKPTMEQITGKSSTTEMSTTDPSSIHQTVMWALNEAMPEGVEYIDFPSQR